MDFYQKSRQPKPFSTISPSTSYWATKILHLTMITPKYAFDLGFQYYTSLCSLLNMPKCLLISD